MEIILNVEPSDGAKSDEFQDAGSEFLESLKNVDGLEVSHETQKVDGARGVIAVLTGIIVTAAKIGAFGAVYALAKDLYERYARAEVTLKFKDGSELNLKKLTHKQALLEIEKHLEKQNQE